MFTAEEAGQALNVNHGAFLDAAERLQHRKLLLKPRQGFYVIVPPQYLSWGAPPPDWYIDELMENEDQTNSYYVGLLKAAEFHGATHQAVMEFQVVAAKRLPVIRAGRSLIVFYYRKNIDAVPEGIGDHKTDTGSMKISSAALTALDLLRYPQAAGGIDNIATVLSDLGHKLESAQLAALSGLVERPVVQRLGYLVSARKSRFQAPAGAGVAQGTVAGTAARVGMRRASRLRSLSRSTRPSPQCSRWLIAGECPSMRRTRPCPLASSASRSKSQPSPCLSAASTRMRQRSMPGRSPSHGCFHWKMKSCLDFLADTNYGKFLLLSCDLSVKRYYKIPDPSHG